MTLLAERARRAAITVPAANVAGSGVVHAGFVILLTEANLPAEIFSLAQADGGDVAFSSDALGEQRLPVHLLDWNAAAGIARLFVRLPSLPSDADTVFYVWYGAPVAVPPAAPADPLGRNAVWADERGVWPLHQGDFSDATGAAADGAAVGTVTPITGKFGGGVAVDRTTFGRIEIPWHAGLDVVGAGRLSAWFRTASADNGGIANVSKTQETFALSKNGAGDRTTTAVRIAGQTFWLASAGGITTDGTWHHVALDFNRGRVPGRQRIIVDGIIANEGDAADGDIVSTSGEPMIIGTRSQFETSNFEGDIELVVLGPPRTPDWHATEFANRNDPASFAIAAAAEDVVIEGEIAGMLAAALVQAGGKTRLAGTSGAALGLGMMSATGGFRLSGAAASQIHGRLGAAIASGLRLPVSAMLGLVPMRGDGRGNSLPEFIGQGANRRDRTAALRAPSRRLERPGGSRTRVL